MSELTMPAVAEILRRRSGDQAPSATLAIQSGIGREGFRIDSAGGQVRITGNDERGLLYGVGKFLRDRNWRGTSVPEKEVRGMYFATHFHNFYHDAPIAAVNQYVEDLALWGCNSLSVWFDMHHYAGLDDPAAQQMIVRLRAILQAANSVGMGAALTSLANEAYASSPVGLRAEPFPSHYHVEICPSRPGGLELILKWREEMLAAFADLNIEHFWIWPYDQGGCGCSSCRPWGANGFLRNAAAVARLVRRQLPRAKTVISTWCFGDLAGDAEWDGFYEALAARPDWADYVMAENCGDYPPYVLQHGAPGGLPLLNFPELSMFNMTPWGGWGANPAPTRFQRIWQQSGHLLAGGYPYSEGIFEDINKVIELQFYWNSQRTALDTVREYIASEFSPAAVKELTTATQLMEAGHGHKLVPDACAQAQQPLPGRLYELSHTAHAAECAALVRQAEPKLTGAARSAWRWRIFAIRAALDAELARTGGAPSELTEQLFTELTGIYYADHAEEAVRVPTLQTLKRGRPTP